jgi:hypothetical protein
MAFTTPEPRTANRRPLGLAAALTVSFALFAPASEAQVRQAGLPAGFWSPMEREVPVRTLPPQDNQALLAEHLNTPMGSGPLRFGVPVHGGFDMARDGVWDVAQDGSQVWRLQVDSPGAFSLGFEFDLFQLPEGAALYVYDPARQNMFGAYTSANHRFDGGFVIEPFPGDRAILEVVVPPDAVGTPDLIVGDVIHDFRNVFELLDPIPVSDGDGAETGCTIDVNCPAGDNWNLQKRATVRTISGGGLCSAALINNTAQDGARYILTADHCGQSSNTTFRFNYQRSGCRSGSAPTNQNVSGAQVLTTSGTVDSRLMRITSNIPSSYNPYFAGWTRATNNTNFAFALGHPGGGPKKISVSTNGTTSSFNFWNASWNQGTLEGGSSGGPLFDAQGRVRGPACCVNGFVCSGQTAFFGRFNRFWTLNGLAQWIDPVGANPTVLDGFDPNGGGGGPIDPVDPEPTIANVAPGILPAVIVDGPQQVVITGTNFENVTAVRVNGIDLPTFPAAFQVVSPNQITFDMPKVSNLGAIPVQVVTQAGSASMDMAVIPNASPTIDLLNSDPGFLFQAAGLRVTMGGEPGSLMLLAFSGSDVPSSLPGVADLGIGNGFLEIWQVGIFTINPTSGWTEFVAFLSGLPPGLRVHFQGLKISEFPLPTTNVQSGTILF